MIRAHVEVVRNSKNVAVVNLIAIKHAGGVKYKHKYLSDFENNFTKLSEKVIQNYDFLVNCFRKN